MEKAEEKGSASGGGSGGFSGGSIVGGGTDDVEKAASLPCASEGASRCEDSVLAISLSKCLSSKKLGDPGFGEGGGGKGGRGRGRGRQGEKDGGEKKSDSFDSAAWCFDGGGDRPPSE